MKIVSLVLLISLVFVGTAEAKGIKLGRIGASAVRVSALRSVANWTHSDYGQYCTPMPTEGTYLCEEGGKSDEMSFLEKQVSQTEQIIATTLVNEYSQASVDSYNFKVRALNDYIDKYNGILTSSCIDISKFCKEYEASGKSVGNVNVDDFSIDSFSSSTDNAIGIVLAIILAIIVGVFIWRHFNSKKNAKLLSQEVYDINCFIDDFEHSTGIKITLKQKVAIIKLNKKIFGEKGNIKITAQLLMDSGRDTIRKCKSEIIEILDGQTDSHVSHYRETVNKYLDLFTTLDEHMNIFREARKVFGTDDLNQLEEHIAENFIRYAKSGEGVIGTLEEMFSKVIDRIESTLGHESEIEKLYKDILDRDRTDKIT